MRGPVRGHARWMARLAATLLAVINCACPSVQGADAPITLPATPAAAEAAPEQDDATLRDVQLMGARHGWAVGDRGVIWKTDDGGQTWQFCATAVKCSLRSVCFLSDQIGWAVGGDIAEFGQIAEGVVLGTTDGGKTWTVVARGGLPFLSHVSFFGLEEGIVAGAANARYPTGVAVTLDGGKSWQPAPGAPSAGWRTAAFVDEKTGALAGQRGRFTTFGGGSVMERAGDPFGLRNLQAIDLLPDGRGWMVGDGGLVLTTKAAGAAWTEPPGELPPALRDCFNIRSVSGHGEQVWIAGAPGSAVWHSADAGASWESQAIGDPAPLQAIDFSSDTHGCAVGALGRILTTEDGGRTWTAARGGSRRAALLALATAAERTPLRLLVKSSAEEGYRSVVRLTARRDTGPDGHLENDTDLRLQQAIDLAGGCESEIEWRLPLATPGLDRDYTRLLEQWSQITDGRLPDIVLQGLVADLRTWRPSVVVIDEPGEHDAAAKLLRQAIVHAVARAADPQQFPEQQELMHLAPWRVERVVARLPSGESSEITLDPHVIVPRQGCTLLMAASSAAAALGVANTATTEHFRMILPERDTSGNRGRSLFGGLALTSGGDARRALPPITELDYEAIEALAQHQRNFAAWQRQALDNEAHAAQVMAQLKDVLANAPAEQAALQLAALADGYKQHAQWQLAEEALIELAERYPNQPPAIDGMVWLLQMWTSQELGWRRARSVSASQSQVRVRGEVAQAVVEQTQSLLAQEGGLERVRALSQSAASPLLIEPVAAQVSIGGREEQ
ncbi:MAG: YCF48-related protein, partial [Planctomycetaceae bacterium]